MNQIDHLETQIAAAIDRLRAVLAAGDKGGGDTGALRARLSEVEGEKAALADELGRLRAKRDKDVAALDELIAQLKPLIEEV
jgi:hypothetical protein